MATSDEIGQMEQFASDWHPLADACSRLGLSVRQFHRLRKAGMILPSVHYYRWGMGSRSPLMVNVAACRLALQCRTHQ